MYVLEFLNKDRILKIFDSNSLTVIEYLLRKALYSQPEILPGQKVGYIQITKEFLEQWIAQGLDWSIVGSGSYPIDVYSDVLKCGADVKFMSAKIMSDGSFTRDQSGETSLGQKFTGSGNELDQDFASKSYDKILDGWKGILFDKINTPIRDYGLKDIYYFIFIRGGDTINLAVARVDVNMIKNLTVGNATISSVFVNGFINAKHGNVKIYKAKKRMELRCLPKNMEDDSLFVKWDFSKLVRSSGVSLRELVEDRDKFGEYVKGDIESFLTQL